MSKRKKTEEALQESQESFRRVCDDAPIMPRKNGREVYEAIKLIDPSASAIFVSGYAEDVISRQGLLEPGINFILKPFAPSALLKKVRELLDA